MFSFILGFLVAILFKTILKPNPVVLYKEQVLNEFNIDLGCDEDMRQFSTVIDDIRLAWDIENLWLEFESLEPVEWEIPKTFKEEWTWGQSHPSEHIERCLSADMSYPILVWEGAIIDGCHRTVKALAMGKKSIKAKVIINIPPPDHQGDSEDIESNDGVSWTYRDMVKIVQAYMEYEVVKDYDFRHPLDGI
jgi:hypothetical protein